MGVLAVHIDSQTRTATLCVVLAGAPKVGKTAAVRSLAPVLHGVAQSPQVYSPEEADGRTLYFDWLEYQGGSRAGFNLRCQIIAVPGQAMLAHRRQRLLEMADVVLMMVDSRPAGIREATPFLAEMPPWLRRENGRAFQVPVVLLANKQDMDGALPVDKVGEELESQWGFQRRFSTVATSGLGLRESFVTAVGLALDQQEARFQAVNEAEEALTVTGGDDLLALLQEADQQHLGLSGATDDSSRTVAKPSADPERRLYGRPLLAWPWNPANRETLRRLYRSDPQWEERGNGDWLGTDPGSGWRLFSMAAHRDLERSAGEQAIRQVVTGYQRLKRFMPTEGFIALMELDDGRTRIWRIAPPSAEFEAPLRQRLALGPTQAAQWLVGLCQGLWQLRAALIQCNLDARLKAGDIGLVKNRLVLDRPLINANGPPADLSMHDLMDAHLVPAVSVSVNAEQLDPFAALLEVQRIGRDKPAYTRAVNTVASMLLEY
ncbi:MAG: hypothetical protein ACPG4N_07845 [Gammaproteobacteria bacterium]